MIQSITKQNLRNYRSQKREDEQNGLKNRTPYFLSFLKSSVVI